MIDKIFSFIFIALSFTCFIIYFIIEDVNIAIFALFCATFSLQFIIIDELRGL